MHVNDAARGGKKRKNINPKGMLGSFCRRRESDESGSADITRRAASASRGCGSIGEDRLKRRTVTGEQEVGRGHCSAQQDVTSVPKHVKGSWPPRKVSCKASTGVCRQIPLNTCRRWEGGEGGGGASPSEGRY